MPETGLGFLLRNLREQRGLSLRELGRLAEVDHAYIHRLEAGDKESPSSEVLEKLIKALKPGKREAEMLHYLSAHSETEPELVGLIIKDQSITYGVFTAVAGMAFRGKRPNYPALIERVRGWESENGNG